MSERFIIERAQVCSTGCAVGTTPEVGALVAKLHALKKDDWPLLMRTWYAIASYAASRARRIARGIKV